MNDKILLRDDVIGLVRSKGPILPSHVAKAINTNIIMASAYLSELVASKIINISNTKVGGSPLYYAPGQEASLLKFADNLNEKERRALELLKENIEDAENSLYFLCGPKEFVDSVISMLQSLGVKREQIKTDVWG